MPEAPILYFSSVDISLPNGPGVNEREFVIALRNRWGERVLCVLPRPENAIPESPREGFFFCIPHRGYRPIRYLGFLVHHSILLLYLAKSRDVGLAITRLGPLPIGAWLLQRWTSVPLAVKTLGRYWRDWRGQAFGRRWISRLTEALNLSIMERAVAIDTVTRQFYARAAKDLGSAAKLLHVENAVNTETFKPVKEKPRLPGVDVSSCWPVLGYAGGVPSQRGARQLVEIGVRLRDEFPKLAILVVGFDDRLHEVVRLAQRHGLEQRCFFVGIVPYERLPDYINCMDLCLALDDADRAATYGNSSQKIRQYLACGKPVIGLDIGNEFLTEAELGSRVHPEDLEGLAEAAGYWTRKLEQEGEAFRIKARRFAVAKLSVEKLLDHRVALWDCMLRAAGRPSVS